MTRLHPTQFRALRSLALEVNRAADLASAAAIIERGTTAMLGIPTIVLSRRLPSTRETAAITTAHGPVVEQMPLPWAPGETQPGWSAGTPTPSPAPLPSAESGAEGVDIPLGEHGGQAWFLILGGPAETPRTEGFLALVRDTLTAALTAPALRHRLGRAEHVVTAAFAFSRGLTKTLGPHALRQFIVDTMAGATRAELGALALFDPAEGELHIAATHGYPAVLVGHVRLASGEGILGRVLESRRPLLVRDIGDLPGASRRPRYRTGSFLAVPLLANSDPLGVVALADRLDGQPFDEGDLTAARALAAPAALALQNDRLTDQTRQLAHAATVDPLTSLFNRRHFHSRIEEEIERARRYSLDLSLLLIDIDDFKRINDTLGHLAGDHLLKQVADILKRSVRVFDVCTRYGGEEFAILMPGSSASNAMLVAERIRTRVASASREDGPLPPHIRITVSLGLAVLGQEASSQELIARADRALYRAKAEGKNRVRME